MVYLNNTTDIQTVYIPRDGVLQNAADTGEYSAGENIYISPRKVISVTGLTEAIQNTVTAMTLNYATTGDVQTMLEGYATTGDVQTMLEDYTTTGDVQTMLEGYATTGDVQTMLEDYTTTGDVQTMLGAYTPTANFATINGDAITEGGNIVATTSQDVLRIQKLTQAQYDALVGNYDPNTLYVIIPASN